MGKKIEKYQAKLIANNYKFTSQRELILEVLIENHGKHLNADDIYSMISETNPNIGLATIYRTLELFSELGIIKQLDFDDSCKRYEIETEDSHHHHLICEKCETIIEFNDSILEDFEDDLKTKHSFRTTDHSIKFYGYCEGCQ